MKKLILIWAIPVLAYGSAAYFRFQSAKDYRSATEAYKLAATNAYQGVAEVKAYKSKLDNEFDERLKYYRLFNELKTSGWSNVMLIAMKDERMFMAPMDLTRVSDSVLGIPLIEIEREEKPSGMRRYRRKD